MPVALPRIDVLKLNLEDNHLITSTKDIDNPPKNAII